MCEQTSLCVCVRLCERTAAIMCACICQCVAEARARVSVLTIMMLLALEFFQSLHRNGCNLLEAKAFLG